MNMQHIRSFPVRAFSTISIEGNIGSGKSSFLKYFSDKYPTKVDVFQEPVDKWCNTGGTDGLSLVYQDPRRWNMCFQSYIGLTMLENHSKIPAKPIKLMERSIHSGKFCFMENKYRSGALSNYEYSVLDAWYEWAIKNHGCQVDLVIYLQTDPAVAQDRIRKRNRVEEEGITLKYLENLHELHEAWLVHRKFPFSPPVITVNANIEKPEIETVYKYLASCMFHQAK